MNSTRLPGKAMLELKGKPVIHHVIERVRASKHMNALVVATTRSHDDDRLAGYLEAHEPVKVFRGPEDDVLERFHLCSSSHPCDLIVRITADDPLKDASIIDEAIERMLDDPSLDYCSNTLKPTYPEGLDIEVFKSSALDRAYHGATLMSEREHVTPYIWKNSNVFKLYNLEHYEDLSAWRWTLDTDRDLAFITAIYEHFYEGSSLFSYKMIIDFVKRNPRLAEINSDTRRNDGYFRSLERDRREHT